LERMFFDASTGEPLGEPALPAADATGALSEGVVVDAGEALSPGVVDSAGALGPSAAVEGLLEDDDDVDVDALLELDDDVDVDALLEELVDAAELAGAAASAGCAELCLCGSTVPLSRLPAPPPDPLPPMPPMPLPMNVLRVANSFASPICAEHAARSPLGNHRAAAKPLICTVSAPRMIGSGGVGGTGGGCAGPRLVAPLQTTVHVTNAAGWPSIITMPSVGGGGTSGGPTTPDGTSKSCVTGSKRRAAANTVCTRLSDRACSASAKLEKFNPSEAAHPTSDEATRSQQLRLDRTPVAIAKLPHAGRPRDTTHRRWWIGSHSALRRKSATPTKRWSRNRRTSPVTPRASSATRMLRSHASRMRSSIETRPWRMRNRGCPCRSTYS